MCAPMQHSRVYAWTGYHQLGAGRCRRCWGAPEVYVQSKSLEKTLISGFQKYQLLGGILEQLGLTLEREARLIGGTILR